AAFSGFHRCSDVRIFLGSGGDRFEDQRDAVDAVAQAGRRWAVIEDVAQMTSAAMTVDGRAYAEAGIFHFSHRVVQRRPEARPTGATVELGGRGEEREIAARAGEIPASFLVKQGTGERRLGRGLAQDGVLLRVQQLAPLFLGMGDFEISFGAGWSDWPFGPQGDCKCTERAIRQKSTPADHDKDLLARTLIAAELLCANVVPSVSIYQLGYNASHAPVNTPVSRVFAEPRGYHIAMRLEV